jgi:hypothetical protein
MRSRAVVAVFLFVVIVASASYYFLLQKELEQQQAIIDQVRPQIEACKSMKSSPSKSVVIRGKALVWDMRSNRQHGAYGRLPSELKATSTDKVITIFAVIGERLEKIGTYEISRQPAYREYVDICVVYWPEQKVVGLYWVVSKEPPSVRQVEYTPEYGDPNVPIADWIAALPKEEVGAPTTIGTPTRVVSTTRVSTAGNALVVQIDHRQEPGHTDFIITVKDPTGNPVSGASLQVTITHPSGQSFSWNAVTNAEGHYTYSFIPSISGTHKLSVVASKTGYGNGSAEVTF